MQKKNEFLAEMYEKKSQFGNIYFSGYFESGGKVVLKKIKGKKNQYGEQIWELLMPK